MRRTRILLVGVSIALGAGGAAAQNLGFLQDSPVARMNREDTAMLARNYQQALDALPDGHTNTWTNPKTGSSGTATPLKTMREKGTTCRVLEITNYAAGQSGRSEWTFCKTKDGWRTSGR
ncbi:MAG TPA: RT0821/Lpp0805 family surface protein [Burkholderiales bacterium]|jgi:surface antigen|nr:RT0821/Lpp0805 family surface protein [Burkholderiales bacterium]